MYGIWECCCRICRGPVGVGVGKEAFRKAIISRLSKHVDDTGDGGEPKVKLRLACVHEAQSG